MEHMADNAEYEEEVNKINQKANKPKGKHGKR